MKTTERQADILRLVLAGDADGQTIDIDQLIEALGLATTKQAIQCSIRFMERKGMLVRSYGVRRGRRRMLLMSVET